MEFPGAPTFTYLCIVLMVVSARGLSCMGIWRLESIVESVYQLMFVLSKPSTYSDNCLVQQVLD